MSSDSYWRLLKLSTISCLPQNSVHKKPGQDFFQHKGFDTKWFYYTTDFIWGACLKLCKTQEIVTMLPRNQWMFSGDGAEFGAVVCQALVKHCTDRTVSSLKRKEYRRGWVESRPWRKHELQNLHLKHSSFYTSILTSEISLGKRKNKNNTQLQTRQ